MSGPKAVVVAPMVGGLSLIPLILVAGVAVAGSVALVSLSSAYLERRKLEARLRRTREYFEELRNRLRALGENADSLVEALESISSAADKLMAEGEFEKAVRLFAGAVDGVEAQRSQLETLLERRIAGIQCRFHEASQRRVHLIESLSQLRIFAGTAGTADWPAAERERFKENWLDALAGIVVPDVPISDLNEAGVARLDQVESQLQEVDRMLRSAKEGIQNDVNRNQAEIISSRLQGKSQPVVHINDWLAAQPALISKPDASERAMIKKLDALILKIGALQDTAGWAELMRRVDAVRAEADGSRRRHLYESLVLDSGRRLKSLGAAKKWIADVDVLLEETEAYAGTAVDAIAEELRELRRAGLPIDLKPWRERLIATQQRELARLERERKRQAILESLADLGYETGGAMETAMAQGGKLVIRKPGDSDYAVELVANTDLSMVQTTMVRYSDSPDLTEQQRRRDHEREEAWCADHGRLREKLAGKGLGTKFKLKLRAGEHPVKIVKKGERAQVAAAKAKRSIQPPTPTH
jgi:hypothetical protein